MFRSASPSAAAPKSGNDAASSSSPPGLFSSSVPTPSTSCIVLTSVSAYLRLGSGCAPPKSGSGTPFTIEDASAPRSSTKMRLAKGPATPFIASKTIEKSFRCISLRIDGKSKIPCIILEYSPTASTTTTSMFPSLVVPGLSNAVFAGSSPVMRYFFIVCVLPYIVSVTEVGAGPPFAVLYLMPKSSFGPPGLCEAVRIIAPLASKLRTRCEIAGVEARKFGIVTTRETPLAAAMRRMIIDALLFKYRPSPPKTRVSSLSSGLVSKMACTKFSR
mmetsp:Transcript_7886/g.9581  ORF Transcript_7886/g.9581 Transcript_7886/m.9581 type:complete len:274 (+) Transcript_7886:973-1794(+)